MNVKNINKYLSKIKHKYLRAISDFLKHLRSRPRLAILLFSCMMIVVSGLILLYSNISATRPSEQITNNTAMSETDLSEPTSDETKTSTALTDKIASLGKKLSFQASPTNTPVPQSSDTDSETSNQNTSQATNTPTPSTAVSGSTQPSATPTSVAAVTPTQPAPTQVAPSPTVTPIPTHTPTPGPIQSNASVTLTSASGATPNAFGSVSFTITQNSNGYWDFITSGTFQMLQPNRPYQLWICSEGCSSHVNARFTTDDAGSGSISAATITYPQGLYPAQTVRINELVDVPPGEVIPTDSTRCYQMTGMTPCLQNSVSF